MVVAPDKTQQQQLTPQQTPQLAQNGGENQPSSYLQMGRAQPDAPTDSGGMNIAGGPMFTAADGSGPKPAPIEQVMGAQQAQLQAAQPNPAMPTPAMQVQGTRSEGSPLFSDAAQQRPQIPNQASDLGGAGPISKAQMFSPLLGPGGPNDTNPGPPPSSLPPASGQPGAPVKLGDLGSLIEKNLGNPSVYDDATMQASLDAFKNRLNDEGENAMAGVDADAAARGLLGGSNPVIDRSKIRDKMFRTLGDYQSNLAMDRAHTYGADRQGAMNNAFQFLQGAQNADAIDAQMAQMAAGLGNQGFGDLVNLMTGMGQNKMDFGDEGGDWASVLGSLFNKPQAAPAAGGRVPLPRPVSNQNSEGYPT